MAERPSALPNNILAWAGSDQQPHSPQQAKDRSHVVTSTKDSARGASRSRGSVPTSQPKIRGILQREGIFPATGCSSNNAPVPANRHPSQSSHLPHASNPPTPAENHSTPPSAATSPSWSAKQVIAVPLLATVATSCTSTHPFCRYFDASTAAWSTSKYAQTTPGASVQEGCWSGLPDDDEAGDVRLHEDPAWRRPSDALRGWNILCTGGCVRRRNATASQLLLVTEEDVYDEEEGPLMEMPCDKTLLLRATVPMPRGRAQCACIFARLKRQPRCGEGAGPIAFLGLGLTSTPNEELKGFPLVLAEMSGEQTGTATLSVSTWRVTDQDVLEMTNIMHAPQVVRSIRGSLTLKLVVRDGSFDVYVNDMALYTNIGDDSLHLGHAYAILLNTGGRVLASQIAIAEGDKPPESRLYQHIGRSPKFSPASAAASTSRTLNSPKTPRVTSRTNSSCSPTVTTSPREGKRGASLKTAKLWAGAATPLHVSAVALSGTEGPLEADAPQIVPPLSPLQLSDTPLHQVEEDTSILVGAQEVPLEEAGHSSPLTVPGKSRTDEEDKGESTAYLPPSSANAPLQQPEAWVISMGDGGRQRRRGSVAIVASRAEDEMDEDGSSGDAISTSVDEPTSEQARRSPSIRHDFLRRGARKATTLPPSARHTGAANPLPEKLESLPEGIDKNLANVIVAEVMERSPNISWDNIAGLADAKRLLKEAVLLPLLVPELFVGMVQPWRGVLLYGPPGTGKTMLAKAVATSAKTTFFAMSAAILNSKHYGESEKLVRTLFQVARHFAPSTIFFDEVDALMSARGGQEHEASRRVKSEMLLQMDGLANTVEAGDSGEERRVLVLATTNRPWDLDDAMRRRLEKRIYIPLPDPVGRSDQIRRHVAHLHLDAEVDLEAVRDATEGFSGADLTVLVRDAAMAPVRRLVAGYSTEEILLMKERGTLQTSSVSMDDFREALRRVQPSVSSESLKQYASWSAAFGST